MDLYQNKPIQHNLTVTIIPPNNSRIHIISMTSGIYLKFKGLNTYNTFSDHNGIKLETHNLKVSGKSANVWKLNTTLLNNTWVKEIK
jgi:hypothetical protein